eukprot:Hpha_TRINITY_DN13157_c0_g1::TRINITY_DN13157_c0_g1_i2::g.113409::m.113409
MASEDNSLDGLRIADEVVDEIGKVAASFACTFLIKRWSDELVNGYAVITSEPPQFFLTQEYKRGSIGGNRTTRPKWSAEECSGVLRVTELGDEWLYLEGGDDRDASHHSLFQTQDPIINGSMILNVFRSLPGVRFEQGHCEQPYLLVTQLLQDRSLERNMELLPFSPQGGLVAGPRRAAEEEPVKVVWIEEGDESSPSFERCRAVAEDAGRVMRFNSLAEAERELRKGGTRRVVLTGDFTRAAERIHRLVPATPIHLWNPDGIPCPQLPSVRVVNARSPEEAGLVIGEAIRERGRSGRAGKKILVMTLGDSVLRAGYEGAHAPVHTMSNSAYHQRHYGGLEVNGQCREGQWSMSASNVQKHGTIIGVDEGKAVIDSIACSQGQPAWRFYDAIILTEPPMGKRGINLANVRAVAANTLKGPTSGYKPAEVLTLAGEELDERETLADAGVGQQAHVALAMRTGDEYAPRDVSKRKVSEGPEILVFVTPPDGGGTMPVEVSMNATVGELADAAVAQWRGHSMPVRPVLYTAAKEVLSLYAYGRADGIVVTVGSSYSRVVPVLRGKPLADMVQQRDVGGRAVLSVLGMGMDTANQKRKPESASRYWRPNLESKIAAVKRHARTLTRKEGERCQMLAKRVKDGTSLEGALSGEFADISPLFVESELGISLNEGDAGAVSAPDLFLAAEILFRTDTWNILRTKGPKPKAENAHPGAGLDRMVRVCVEQCAKVLPPADLARVCSSVVLDGGGSNWSGLTERLTEELWQRRCPGVRWSLGGLELPQDDCERLERAYVAVRFPREGRPVDAELSFVPSLHACGRVRINLTAFTAVDAAGRSIEVVRKDPQGDAFPSAAYARLPEKIVSHVLSFLEPLDLFNPQHKVLAKPNRTGLAWRGGSLLASRYAPEILNVAAAGIDTEAGIGKILFP